VARNILDGGITGIFTSMGARLGENWSVRIEQVGAFMVYLAIDGVGEDAIIENARIVTKGKELLQSQQRSAPES
jgi:hypothetical protein